MSPVSIRTDPSLKFAIRMLFVCSLYLFVTTMTLNAARLEEKEFDVLGRMVEGTQLRVMMIRENAAFAIARIETESAPPIAAPQQTSNATTLMKEKKQNLGRLFKGLLGFAVATSAPAAIAQEDEENVFVLSPFEVTGGDENTDYILKDSLGGTRLRTATKDIAAAITVLSKEFLLDTGSTDNDSLLVYVPSTEVSGSNGSFLGRGDGENVNGNARISNSTRVRGLDVADNTRGYFGTEIPWDSYNVSRIDLQRGPNSILFGLGSPGGIVNATLEGAVFGKLNEIANRLDEHGSVRWNGTFNRELIDDELAVRISVLESQTKYKQDPAHKDDSRIFGAIRWEPSFLKDKIDGTHSTLRANFESGEINATLPNLTPPLDYVSPYFNESSYRDGSGNLVTLNPLLGPTSDDYPYIGPYHIGSSNGVITAFTGEGVQGATHAKRPYGHLASYPADAVLLNPPGSVVYTPQLRGTLGYGAYLNQEGEFNSLRPYKEVSLTNPSWFDFYNNTIDGPNNWSNSEFDAYNVAWEQTFMDNTFGYELVYDSQEVTNDSVQSSNPGRQALHIDIMDHFVDGTANPNVGRLFYAINASASGISYRESKTESVRATAFYTLDFAKITQPDGLLSKLFGKNTFTALSEERTEFVDTRSWGLQTQTITQPDQSLRMTADHTPYSDVKSNASIYYFGPSYAGTAASSPDDAGGVGIKHRLIIEDSTINAWDPLEGGQGLYETSIHTVNQGLVYPPLARDYNIARLNGNDIKSQAFVWQGSWLGDTVLPLIGLRKDEVEARRFQAGGDADGVADTTFGSYQLPDELDSFVEGDTETYGVVVKVPEFIKEKIGGMDVRLFWSKAENFKPEAGRRDYYGESIPNPAGTTDEYGLYLESANGKYSLRATKYETEGTNVTLPSGVRAQNFSNYINWVSHHAHRQATEVYGPRFGFTSDGRPVQFRPAGRPTVDDGKGGLTWTQAQKDARKAATDEILADYFSKEVDPRILENNGTTNYFTQVPPYGAPLATASFPNVATTGGTFSDGYEFEFSARPIQGLNIMVNASKTSARRAGLAGSYDNVLAEFDWLTSGPAGKLMFWANWDPDDPDHPGGGYPSRSQEQANLQWARGWYNQMKQGYDFFKALENSDVAELRPWSVNAVVSYQFQEGKYKGLRIGGSSRYQDGRTLGFPVIPRPNAPEGLWTYDVLKPIKGDSQTNYDLFASYNWKLGQNINVNTRLNIRNVFASDELIPVTVQPDGTPASYRIAPPKTIYLSNTISF